MFEDLKNKFNILNETEIKPDIRNFEIKKEDIKQVLKYLKTSPMYLFERLDCIYASNFDSLFSLTYLLNSDKYNLKCAITCKIQDGEDIASVYEIYKSADYEECEIYDLFGIKFINHPDLRRILLPDSFNGHPLRKDYAMNDERLGWNYD